MSKCNQDCNQGRTCDCKGIPLDYGKEERMIFLNRPKSNPYIKLLILFTALYFLGHIGYALAEIVTIHNPAEGTIKSCIINNGYITCI